MHCTRIYTFAIALVSTCLAGCQAQLPTKSIPVQSQDEAASFLVSPTTVMPWNQISDAMQPNFALNGDQALSQVAPVTSRVQEQVLNAFGLTLGVGFPQTSSTASNTASGSQDLTTTMDATGTASTTTGKSGTSTSSTTSTAPGTAPTAPTGMPAGTQAATAAFVSGDLGIDPVLKYQSALALFETVQMLNRETQNAATLSDSVPFLVRLKFAVMPYRPHLPYSLHSRISFFPDCENGDDNTPLLRVAKTGAGKKEKGQADSKGATEPKDRRNSCPALNADMPQIIPLLAADDIERALRSSAIESARQIGLAISAMTHGIGASAGLNNLNQVLSSVAEQDLNSRLTVTRQSDNTLYVRIAASNETTSLPSLVGQTYDVALLLLVPRTYFGTQEDKSSPEIRIVTHTEFRNALDGTILPDRPKAVLVKQVDRVMHQALVGAYDTELQSWDKLTDVDKEAVARTLAKPVQRNYFDDFSKLLAEGNLAETVFSLSRMADSIGAQQNLWTALSTVLADTSLKSAYFQLRWPQDVGIPDQTALVADDSKEKAQIQLWGVTGSSSATLAANLKLAPKSRSAVPITLPAQTLSLDQKTHVLTLGFASPTKWGIGDIDSANKSNVLSIQQPACPAEVLCPDLRGATNGWRTFDIQLVKVSAQDATPDLTFTAKVTQIIPDKGSGSVSVSVDKLKDDSATVTLDGADIASIADSSGTSIAVSNSGCTVSKATTLTYQLRNLRVGATVTASVEGKKADVSTGKKTLSFAVVAN